MSEPSGTDKSTPKLDSRLRAFETVISRLLQIGVVSSLFVVVFGTALSFVHHPDYRSMPSTLQRLTTPGAAFPQTLSEVWTGVSEFRGQAIVVVGLLMLVLTPVARVAVSIVGFVLEGDRTFALVTAFVLAMLILSFVLGKAGG